MHTKILPLFILVGLMTFGNAACASSADLRSAIDFCSSKNPTNFSLISRCINTEYRGFRGPLESDFFIFMEEIDEEFRAKKASLAKAKGSLVRAWQDLDNKEKSTASANEQRRIQEEQNRIAEDQKRQFEVMREQNYRACVRRNCVSFVDECTQSRMHCVP